METDRLKALWREAFGDEDAFIDLFFEKAYDPRRSRSLTVEGNLAAMLYWFDCTYRGQKIAYVYAVATKQEFRGRGLCARLMEETHKALKDQGYAAAMLLPAGEDLRRMYGKMGYADCCTAAEFTCAAGGKTAVREISAEEFKLLRRKFLQSAGVIQEGENLDFLAALTKFYAGEDFLLAAATEGERLTAAELLGNKGKAPGILAALGCKTGTFRTPGEGPDAMLCPLGADVQFPAYLGLVFD